MRLRERVYFQTVPALAGAIARRLGRDPAEADLDDAYEQVMVILFRLLFVAYAKDKDLLPYRNLQCGGALRPQARLSLIDLGAPVVAFNAVEA